MRWFLICLLLLGGCQADSSDIIEQRFMMGTLVSFTVSGMDEDKARAAIRVAADEMQRVERLFTIYGDAPNTVKAFNAADVGQAVALDTEVESLLNLSLQISRQSTGAFDPALGALNVLWGFSNLDAPTQPPAAAEIKARVRDAKVDYVQHRTDGWVRLRPRTMLDFGGIAKGYAIDRGVEALKAQGITHAIINAGGDLRVVGDHLGKPWRVGVRDPRGEGTLGWLEVDHDMALVTSGDYERFFSYQGQRYHHILDPKTGYPATKSRSVTVIADSATLADAWSTAMFVLGSQQGMPLSKQLGGMQVLWVDADGQEVMTAGLADIFHHH